MFKQWGTGDLVRDEEVFDGTTEYNKVEAFVGDDSPNHIDLNRVVRNLWENEETLYEYLTSIANVQEVERGIYKNSISGNELRLDSNTDVVALDFVANYESYDVSTVANAGGALGGTYFEFYSADGDHYYVWYNSDNNDLDPGQDHPEITEITVNLAVDITELDGAYFLIHSTTAQYYVWYNLDGLSSDPAPGGIGIPVAIITGDTENIIATKTAVQINNNAAFAATPSSNVITITNDVAGAATDATIGTTNFSVNVTQDGQDQIISADLGAEVNITTGDTADQVKNSTITKFNGVFSKLSASDLGTGNFLITSTIPGDITPNLTVGTSTFTLNSLNDGSTDYKYFARVAPGIVYFNNEIFVSIPQTNIAERQLERILNLRTWLPIPEKVEINYSREYDNYQVRVSIYDTSNVLQNFDFTNGATWGMPSTGGYNTGIEAIHAVYKSSQFHKTITDNVAHDLLKFTLEPTSEILQTASGLVIYYPFRGGSADDLAGTYNGTINEATTSVGIADAIFDGGYGIALDGVNDYIETLPFEEIPDGAFTMSIWAKANAFDSADQSTLFSSWNDTESRGIYAGTVNADPSQFVVKVDNGTGSPAEVQINNPFTVGGTDWTLLVVNFDPETKLEVFVNGEFVEAALQDGSVPVATDFANISSVVPSPVEGDFVYVTNETAYYRYFELQAQWILITATETGVDIPHTIKEQFLTPESILYIGRRGDSISNYFWNGDVDEFAVFDRIITAQRRKDLWDLRNPVDTNYLEVSYPLDDGTPSNNLVDRSGKNRDTVNNGAALIRGIRSEFNEEGRAAYFDENGDGIDIPASNFDLNEGSFSMWFYLNDFANAANLFTSYNSNGANYEWKMYHDGTDLYWRVGNDTTTYDALVGTPETNKWHNMIVTWLYDSGADETTLNGYLDGQAGGSVVLDGNISTATNVSIGNYWDGAVYSNNEIDGKLAYTSVYDIVLDSRQIEDVYNLRLRNTLGTVSHFAMDFTLTDFSNNPATFYDATNYNNNGFILNGANSDPATRARPAIGPDETILTAANNSTFSCAEFIPTVSTEGYIENTTNPTNIFSQASGSFSAWVYFDDLTDAANIQPVFFNGNGGGGSSDFYGATTGTNLQWTFGNGSASQTVQITATMPEGEWHHVVITWEFVGGTQTNVETFFDNVAGGTASISGQISSPTSGIFFGNYNTEFMDGRMEEVVIYDVVITSDDIDSLYRMRKPRSLADVTAWYPMNDGVGTTVNDFSGNGYNSTFNNQSWLPGIGGNALDFDGNGDMVNFSSPIERKVRFSMAFWIFPDSPVTGATVFQSDDTTFDMRIEKTSVSNEYKFYSTGNTPVANDTVAFTATDLDWTHIAIVGDGTNVTVYTDGVAGTPITQTGFFAPGQLYFGRDPLATGNDFKGMMSDIVLYDYNISTQEIDDLVAFNNPSVGLVANYKYEASGNDFVDDSENENDGTVTGIDYIDGFGGRALEFDGIDDYFNIPVAAFNQDAGSYSAWVYFEDVLTQQPMFFTSTDNTNGANYEFRGNLNAGNLEWIIPNGTTTTAIDFGAISERTWYHVVLTWEYDGTMDTTVQAFLDGTLADTETVTGQIPDVMDNISVGVYRASFMKGAVDQLALYSRVLSQSEIDEINAAKRSNMNPIVHYRMEENAGTTLNDDSGSENDGTLQGPSWTVGVSGSSIEFDGFNDYFETTSTVDGTALFSGGEISVAFWIRRRDDYKARSIPFTYGLDATDGLYFELGQASNTGKFIFNNAGNAYDILTTPITVDDTDWTHIAITYTTTGDQWIVYVNGTQHETGSLAASMVFPNRKIYLGAYYDGTHQYHFDGLLDEVAIFDKVLVSTEVTDLYNFRTTSPSGIPTNVYLGFNSDFELDNSGVPFNNSNGFDLYTFSYTTAANVITVNNLSDLRDFYQRSNDFKTQSFYNVPSDISSLDAGTELYTSMDYNKVENQDVEWIVLRQNAGSAENAVYAWDEAQDSFTFNKDIIVEGQSFANVAASIASAVPSAATFSDIPSVVPSPVDGNLCFVRDENQFYRYLGQSSLWIPVSSYISQFKTATVTLDGNQNVPGNDLRFEYSGITWRTSGSNLMVLVNGIVQLESLDYTIVDSSTIEFLSGTLGADFEDDDRITVMVSTGGEEILTETVTYYAGTAKSPYDGASNYIYQLDFPALSSERMRVHRDGLLQQGSELRVVSEPTSNATNTTIIDTGLPTLDASWVDNFVLGIVGANQGIVRQIQSVNDGTKTITLKSAMPSISQTGDQYQIYTDYDFLSNNITNEIVFSDQLTINAGARIAIEQSISIISNADINLAGTSFPTGIPLGTEFYRTDLGSWFKYNGTSWIQI